MCLTLKLIEDFHNCKKGAGPEGRNLESGNALRSLSVAEIVKWYNRKMSVSQLYLTAVLFSRLRLSLQLYLSSLPHVSVLSPAPSHDWKHTRGL